MDQGHALLVGVGGSGRQSLARLAAFTAGYEVFEITLSRGYGEDEFREDLKQLYYKLGLENKKVHHVCMYVCIIVCMYMYIMRKQAYNYICTCTPKVASDFKLSYMYVPTYIFTYRCNYMYVHTSIYM